MSDTAAHQIVPESSSDAKPRRPSRRARLVLLSLPIFGVIISLLFIEVVFRIWTSVAAKPVHWSDRPREYFVPETAKTLQDYSYVVPKPAGTYRIAVVGDSFSFAPYMQFDDAFPKRLERWLNLNEHQPKVEVINYGVPRYSTSHEVRITERALEEGADLVLLQITLNDPEIKPYWPTGLLLDPESGQVKLENPVFRHWKSLAYVVTRWENSQTHNEYRDYFFKLFNKTDTWNNFSGSLRKIENRCADRKIPLVAVVFPLFGYPVDDRYPFLPIHEKIKGRLDELKLPSLDITNAFRDLPLPRLQVIPEGDRHPNEIAHRIAAEEILSWLRQEKLVPAEILPKRSVPLRVGLTEKVEHAAG